MIHIVIGTKAQLIKMAPIMVRLHDRGLPYNFIYTGQHRETMNEMVGDFGIKGPDVVLYDGPDITSVAQMLLWAWNILWKSVFRKSVIFGNNKKGIVLVHGDTFSTLLGALMGRLSGLRVGHVESGLRSFNIFHPFPEEITRILTFRLSHTLYCPGRWAMDNVSSVKREKVDMLANTMSDTLGLTLKAARRKDHIPNCSFGLVSLHRYENIFRKAMLEKIIVHLERVAYHHQLLFILHPPTEKQLRKLGLYERLDKNSHIGLRPRYHHSDFISLLERCEFVITDGGSLQEETSYLGIPCLLMRKTTERKEGLGENVILSNYDRTVIDDFMQCYLKYRCNPIHNTCSPSDIVIESALSYT